MMEKYGADVQRYEVVKPVVGKPDDFLIKGANLSLADANELQKLNPGFIVRPE
jgi:hypothetical protein